MNQEEFNKRVSKLADWLANMPYPPPMLMCACIEAACKIGLENDKGRETLAKFRDVANLLAEEIATQ